MNIVCICNNDILYVFFYRAHYPGCSKAYIYIRTKFSWHSFYSTIVQVFHK